MAMAWRLGGMGETLFYGVFDLAALSNDLSGELGQGKYGYKLWGKD